MTSRALIVGSMGPVSAAVIRSWIEAGHSVAAFWRGTTPTLGPVKRDRRLSWILPKWSITALARKHDFPVRDVSRLSAWPQAASEAKATGADVLISTYFPYLIPQSVLEIFSPRVVNFHPAPLPRYRGPSPILAMTLDRSILTDGCMTLHVVNEAFDAGAIIAREPVALSPDLSIYRYELDLAQAAARLTRGALQSYLAGTLEPVAQDEDQATYAGRPPGRTSLSPEMTADEIHWLCQTLGTLHPLAVSGTGWAATGFRAVTGPSNGAPPAAGPLSVEFDASDARVRLRRKPPFARQLRRIRSLIEMARMPG